MVFQPRLDTLRSISNCKITAFLPNTQIFHYIFYKNMFKSIKRETHRPLSCAESEGFEPPVRRNAYTAFRVRLFRPLRQLSLKAGK